MDNQNSKFHLPKIPAIIWIQLLLLAIGYAFYSANRLSFGVGLKAIAAQLALTPIQVGTLGTIFTLGQALIDIPAGYLADKFGRKRLLVSSMVFLGIMTAIVTKASDVIQVGLARTIFGMAEGMWNIVMYSVAGSIFPAARAMLNGLMMTFYAIGAYVGPTYYGYNLSQTGEWTQGLFNIGLVTIAFGILLFFGFRKKYTDVSTDVKGMHLVEAVKAVGTNKIVWLAVAIQILNIVPYWGFASMGPYLFMTFKGFSAAEAGQFFGMVYGIGLHAIYVLGYTIAQDGVSHKQIGLATGLVGASSYFLSFFSGPFMGWLTSTWGHMIALDIVVVAFEAVLVVVAIIMKETQKKHTATIEEN